MGTKQKIEPRVMLHGRILYRNRHGSVSDVTDGHTLGLTRMAERGELALHILRQSVKKLKLLALAAEHRSQLDASLVRLAVEDVSNDLEGSGELASYVGLTQELFANSTALLPSERTQPGEVLYQVCDTAPDGSLELIGRFQYSAPEEAECELRERQRSVPTALLARLVLTRYDESVAQEPLQTVQG